MSFNSKLGRQQMTTDLRVVACIGCGADVPAIDGPTHRYMESSPGCWQLYGEVLAREYSDLAFWASHRLTVDTYAVQHPGRPSLQTIQSVAVHLISLCLLLEQKATPEYAIRAMRAAAAVSERFKWLPPPSSMGGMTVVNVHGARDAESHAKRVRAWAEAAWSAWSQHHQTVRSWIPEGAGHCPTTR
jgi:hypothetical protein